MKRNNSNVLSAVDTASQNGAAIDAGQLISASFQAVFGDATAAGTFLIQASNDVPPAQIGGQPAWTPTNWTAIPNATATITSGASAIITITQLAYRWIRVVYTRSGGGSTTISVNMFAISI